ncbi:hypothetical protein ACRS5S_29125 [Nocardia asiatica]|uniref:hypothetical protein n=1 Tax=Nocardia asiatica TaxID=209252 RepID=UPI003EE1A0A6
MVLVVNLGGTDSVRALADAAARHPEVAQALNRGARPRELRVDADGAIRVVPIVSRAATEPDSTARGPRETEHAVDSAQPASGDGGARKPPTAPPSADEAGDEPGPPSDWYFQMRIEQADWEADMAADHAAWLRELADAAPDDRWARLRAEQAEWDARMAADRAAWLRLEQAENEAWSAAMEADRSRRAAADPDDPWAELRAQQAEWNARMAEDRAQWLRRLYSPIGTAPLADSGPGTSTSADPKHPAPSIDVTPEPGIPPRSEARTGDGDGPGRAPSITALLEPGVPPRRTSDSADPARTHPAPSVATPSAGTPPRGAEESRIGDAAGSDLVSSAATPEPGIPPRGMEESTDDAAASQDPRDRMSPETRAEYDRLADELERAQARRDDLRRQREDLARQLPIDDADDWAALRPGTDGLDRTLEDLRGRTMPVAEMPQRLARIDALEQAARDFAAADAEVARLATELTNLELSTTPIGEYDRLVQQRQKLTREREFWRAKRDDRVARSDFWGDNVTLDESALRGDQLEITVLRLYEAANVRTIMTSAASTTHRTPTGSPPNRSSSRIAGG